MNKEGQKTDFEGNLSEPAETQKGQENQEAEKVQESHGEKKMIPIPEDEYLALKEQVTRDKDKYARLLAEFENARKRQDRERTEFIKYANEGLVLDFLHIVDDFERTVNVAKEKHQDYEGFLKGVEMVMKRVQDLLKKQGVELIDPVGKPFDPYAHEIIAQEPHPEYKGGEVIDVFQKGYKLGDRVVRTAKVKVAIENKNEEKKENDGKEE
ncbi:MAG: nucleotide exchange factor GrpE [Candidatus Omnitrophota bacterium]